MKKKYLFVSSFFIIGTVLTLVFYFSYQNYNKSSKQSQAREQANTVDTVQEIRLNSKMKYVVEVYDGTTGVVTTEEGSVPVELAGLSREELEGYISRYNATASESELADGPDSKELVSFSKDKVVVREIYDGAEEETGFFLKLDNEEVVIFHKDKVTPYEYTGIRQDVLPEDEKERLLEGYFVEDEKELYSVLENLSS